LLGSWISKAKPVNPSGAAVQTGCPRRKAGALHFLVVALRGGQRHHENRDITNEGDLFQVLILIE
jgi:hypothetical protein